MPTHVIRSYRKEKSPLHLALCQHLEEIWDAYLGSPQCVHVNAQTDWKQVFPQFSTLSLHLEFSRFNRLAEKKIESGGHRRLEIPFRFPIEQPLRISDTGTPVLKILIAFSIVSATFRFPETRKGGKSVAQWVLIEHRHQHLCKLTNTRLIIGIAQIYNLTIALPPFVFNSLLRS
jgi:hypothetical protein